MNILKELAEEGLIKERVFSGSDTGGTPKVNPDMPQGGINKADQMPDSNGDRTKTSDPDPKDDKKDEEPTKKADEAYEDRKLKAAVKAMEAADAALEMVCAECGDDYSDDKKTKLTEIYESSQKLKEGLYEMYNVESY